MRRPIHQSQSSDCVVVSNSSNLQVLVLLYEYEIDNNASSANHPVGPVLRETPQRRSHADFSASYATIFLVGPFNVFVAMSLRL